MLILIGCEESQEVCKAFRALGHEAYSCDLLPCSGGHPEWHLQIDINRAIRGGYLPTQAGGRVFVKEWFMIGLHCPCTYTALCGNRWYWNSPLRIEGIEFTKSVYELAKSVCDKVYLEQPKTIMQKYIGPKTQAIQPYQFGHGETKETWLWLHGLPLLQPTDEVPGRVNRVWKMPPSEDRGKIRSKTYNGIANAIAKQFTL